MCFRQRFRPRLRCLISSLNDIVQIQVCAAADIIYGGITRFEGAGGVIGVYAVYMYKLAITVTVFSRRIVYSAVVRVDDEIVVFISALKKSYVIGISYRAGGLKFICAKDRSSLYVENVRKAVLKLAPLIAQANEQLKPAVAVEVIVIFSALEVVVVILIFARSFDAA